VGLLTLAAGLLRLLFVANVPPGLQGDEAWMGLEAQRILEEGWIGIWSSTGWGQPAGTFYWTAFLFSFLPDNNTVLRLSMALLGAATVPLFYFLVRDLYGRRPAIIGTVLLAFSYWHIDYSRTAFSLVSVPLMECAVLLLMAKGMKARRAWPFAAAGLLAGVGIYTYRGYAFFALVLVVLWGVILVARPYAMKRLASHFLLFALPALLLAVPMVRFVATRYDDYMGYTRLTSIFNSPQYQKAEREGRVPLLLAGKALRAVAIYYAPRTYVMGFAPDDESPATYSADSTDGMGFIGLLDPVTGLVFAVGMAVSLRRARDWRYFLVIAGVLSGVAVAMVAVEWGENRRVFVALPMVFAAAGIGGDRLLAWTERRRERFRRLLRRCFAGGLAFVVVWNVVLYFGIMPHIPAFRFAYAYELSDACAYMRSLEDERPYVYFYSGQWRWDYEARRFQAPGFDGEDRSREFGTFSLERDASHSTVLFLLMGDYSEYGAELQRLYPGGEYTEQLDKGGTVFSAYLLQDPL
jgi:4-amino-4-deoxy-L-arabinose transferase-like glycosyltransferase